MKSKNSVFFYLSVFTSLITDCVFAEVAPETYSDSKFEIFLLAGSWLVWLILLPLSVLTVSLIFQYCLLLRRNRQIPPMIVRNSQNFLQQTPSEQFEKYLKKHDCLLSRTLLTGLSERQNSREAMEAAMADLIEQDATFFLRKIEWLNIIGNVAPMVGLFGTVWGMIDAFQGIVLAGGQPEPADLADGISKALVTTWWGLVVAIPALSIYGFLRNRVDALAAEAWVKVEELLLRNR